MSRIQDILNKAEREGTARRTRDVGADATGQTGASVITPPESILDPAPRRNAPDALGLHNDLDVRVRIPSLPPLEAAAFDPAALPIPSIHDVHLHPSLVAGLDIRSSAAERYRALRTRIVQQENGTALRVLMVTSPGKGDGKTMTALNLALTMAQEFQRRVLIVDCDLRQPSVHRLLGVSNAPGLADVLAGAASIDQAMVTLAPYRLTVLPAGMAPGHLAEFFGSAPMRRLIETLRSRFDRIVFDTPPATLIADAASLAPLTDGVLLVVRAGLTTKPAIERAIAGFGSTRVLGLVLNETDAAEEGYPRAVAPAALR